MIDFTTSGRMIALSKSEYLANHNHRELVIFNAAICSKSEGRIWAGDLDLSTDVADLVTFASHRGEVLYVIRENDAIDPKSPAFDKAVATISKDGMMEIRNSFD